MKREIIIAKDFKNQAKEIYDYIAQNSPQNAEKFIKELLGEINKIEKNPEAYPPITNFNNITHRYRFKIFMKSFNPHYSYF